MRCWIAIALTLVVCTRPLAVAGRDGEGVPLNRIDALFQPLVTPESPGFAVGVIRDGRLIFSRGYGDATLKSASTSATPITSKTNFRLASVTKQFTAMAVMLLVHDGKLRYDDPLTKFFPEFPAYGKQITVRQLLNHSSGLKDYEDVYAEEMAKPGAKGTAQLNDRDVLRMMEAQTKTIFPPGSRWQYSNGGYVLLGEIVARVSGKSFPDFLRDRIFRPLGMNNSVALVEGKNTVPNRALGYRKEGNAWVLSDQSPTSATLGDGGVYTSIDDLVKWVRALDHNTLLSAAEMREAFTPVQVRGVEEPDHTPAEYGFGWFLNPYKGHRRTWHYGETCGFLNAIQRFPDDHLTVIVLSNRIDAEPGPLALKIADMWLGEK